MGENNKTVTTLKLLNFTTEALDQFQPNLAQLMHTCVLRKLIEEFSPLLVENIIVEV